jgi:hypothetical protein
MEITKYVLPVVVGAMSGMILIVLGQIGIFHLYPLAADTDLYDAESLAKAVKHMHVATYILLLINYCICSLLAGIIATLVAQRTTARPAVVIGIVLTLSGVYYVVNMPYPLWYSILNLLVYMPFAYLGYLIVRKKVVNSVA